MYIDFHFKRRIPNRSHKNKSKIKKLRFIETKFSLPSKWKPKKTIVLQENLILNDDSLLQEDIPKGITDPLPPIQPIASQPLGDCEKSYYAIAKKGYSNNELLIIISHLISMLTKRKMKEHKKTNQKPSKKRTNDIPKPESFPPSEEIQKYQQLMAILKPYHNPKKDILITITDIVNTLEQARDLLQNMTADTTRVSQSASYVRTSLDEINYIFETSTILTGNYG